MARAIVNNKAYDSADVVVHMLGFEEEEVYEISYTTSQEHQLNHSLKSKATSWSMGKVSHQATLTLPLNAVSKIERAAGGDLLRVKPFQVDVTYINDYNSIINDTLWLKFQDQGREVTGGMNLQKQYSMFVLDTSYNNA